jgi:large subunit ribosomal protein L18
MVAGSRKEQRRKIHERIRRKVHGTAERPRLSVAFSNQHVYAQIVDDEAAKTLTAASTIEKSVEVKGSNVSSATKVGEILAIRAREKNIAKVVFDRGGSVFHGKVKALADAAKAGGLKF